MSFERSKHCIVNCQKERSFVYLLEETRQLQLFAYSSCNTSYTAVNQLFIQSQYYKIILICLPLQPERNTVTSTVLYSSMTCDRVEMAGASK